MTGEQANVEKLAEAVMDFVRAIRNDSRIEELSGDATRRRKLIKEHAEAVAGIHGVEPKQLVDRTASMMLQLSPRQEGLRP